MAAPKVVIQFQDPNLDPDTLMYDGMPWRKNKAGRPVPWYTSGEVAKFFFGKSRSWLHFHDGVGDFVFNGVPIGGRDKKSDWRIYTLEDVEKMAHAATERALIDGVTLKSVLQVVRLEGVLYGYH